MQSDRLQEILALPELTVWDIRQVCGGSDAISKQAVIKALNAGRIKGAYKRPVGGLVQWFAPTPSVFAWRAKVREILQAQEEAHRAKVARVAAAAAIVPPVTDLPRAVVVRRRKTGRRKPAPRRGAPGYVYVIAAETEQRWYKVGRAQCPDDRLKQIGMLLPFPVRLVASYECPDAAAAEGEVHQLLAAQRINGEWFDLTDDDLAGIREHFKGD